MIVTAMVIMFFLWFVCLWASYYGNEELMYSTAATIIMCAGVLLLEILC